MIAAVPEPDRPHRDLGAAAVEIQSVDPGSPAARAQRQDGDLLVRFATVALDGVRITVAITPAWPAPR